VLGWNAGLELGARLLLCWNWMGMSNGWRAAW
jgi:hypothetical protein